MQSKRHSFAYCKWSNQPIAGDHNYKPIIVGEPLNYKRLTETNWISTNTLINKTHFFEIGGFDESLPRFQDWDLFLTFLEKGFLGIFCDEILFETGHRSSKIFDRSEGDYPKYDEVLAVLRKKHKII